MIKSITIVLFLPPSTEKDDGWIEVSLVVLAPVTAEDSGRMFVLMKDFTIDRPDDTVINEYKTLYMIHHIINVINYLLTPVLPILKQNDHLPESVTTTGSNPL